MKNRKRWSDVGIEGRVRGNSQRQQQRTFQNFPEHEFALASRTKCQGLWS